ncbi:hypothetical protein [Nocardioides sp. YIM 152315]|uniref:hypothetical protein n=1 Tax=Nocardioides sp. YIM 152315 TaxID=3031760 RepID=UPI0023DA9344|nr:hypothetical protein [Nocardioides sp. YIM 152315]MDF1603323.1 hypothetical protein [Nocardioides sp. YIM 152315]
MQVLTAVPQVLLFVVALADEAPEAEDVKAGWLAFAIFIGLILAVAFLGFSLVKQLRKVDAAEDAGLYDPSDRKPVPQPTVEQPSAEPERTDDTAQNGS